MTTVYMLLWNEVVRASFVEDFVEMAWPFATLSMQTDVCSPSGVAPSAVDSRQNKSKLKVESTGKDKGSGNSVLALVCLFLFVVSSIVPIGLLYHVFVGTKVGEEVECVG